MNGSMYFEPTEIEEALELLSRYGNDARLMAGGTDLIIDVTEGRVAEGHIINLMSIDSTSKITGENGLCIGATVLLDSIEHSPRIIDEFQMLSEAASVVGSWQIRVLGTMGGNMCNALPCADTAPPLYAADAVIEIAGQSGRRVVPAESFILAPRKNVLEPGEMLVGFRLPKAPRRTGSVFVKHIFRKALDMTIISLAVAVTLDARSDVIRRARVALGSAAPTPIRTRQAEAVLEGNMLTEELAREAADLVVGECRVHDSPIRASAEYRRDVIRVLARRCIQEAVRRAGQHERGGSDDEV